MRVKILKNGDSVEVNDSYGARLIEQGKAVADRMKRAAAKTEKPSGQPPADGKTVKKTAGRGD